MASSPLLPAARIPLPSSSPEVGDGPAFPGSPDDQSESSTDPSGKSTFYQKLKIDFREPVGNLSISPAGRDVVLAARKGLFIIDLEQPYSSPRFLPQGGTWEVADVQWNPHPSRAELIVSTSSQKLLIWNLYLSGKSSIDQILHAHYRAITDLNWHAYEPEVIASCGIDSWIWSWDLRQGPKPTMGFCAWNASATQVKWNRQDEHLLASSHDNCVLVWDRRKGSVPLITMRAHESKIYGIDWSRRRRNELVTCGLDKTIKFWRFDELARVPHAPLDHVPHATAAGEKEFSPTRVIHTGYPVWRARHLPFGHGVLSLPQRGENALDMWSFASPDKPVYQFEGHTNVVKEFVWRVKGGADLDHDDREFQLITWSKDHTLRGWPLERSTAEKVGFRHGAKIKVIHSRRNAPDVSFRLPPAPSPARKVTFSAPVAGRSILAGVRATPQGSLKPPRTGNDKENHKLGRGAKPKKATFHDGGFMTRGHARGRPARSGLDQMTWISSVKLEKKTDQGSTESPERDRPPSQPHSRGQSLSRASSVEKGSTRRTRSSSREPQDERPSDIAQEMANVAQTYSPRVKFERIDVTARTCTISLHGPWLESDSVFLRATFTFPSNYPRSNTLSSTPHIELEKTSSLPLRTRAYLLRHLRELRMQRRPCLEPCVRFLLGMPDTDGRFNGADPFDDDDESDDEERGRQSAREAMARKFNMNVPTARRGGATFGPNGELVYFYAPTLRILPQGGRLKTSRSPSILSRHTTLSEKARLHEHDANPLSNAMAGLLRMSQNPEGKEPEPPSRATTRAPSNDGGSGSLLGSATKPRTRGSGTSNEQGERLALRTTVISPPKVFIRDVSHFMPSDKELAKDYSCRKGDLVELCETNVSAARQHGRPDHERVWMAFLSIINVAREDRGDTDKRPTWLSLGNPLTQEIVKTLLLEAESAKDVQMLGMIACLLLQNRGRKRPREQTPTTPTFVSKPPAGPFSLKSPLEIRLQIPPPTPPHLQSSPNLNSPSPPSVPSTSSRNSSSWSSLASKLLRGTSETTPPPSGMSRTRTLSQEAHTSGSSPERAPNSIPVKSPWKASQARLTRLADRITNDATSPTGYKSLTDPVKSLAGNAGKMLVTFMSEGNQTQREHSVKTSKLKPTPEHPQMVLQWRRAPNRTSKPSFFTAAMEAHLRDFVTAYAELLLRWQLFERRAELWEASFPPQSRSQEVRDQVPDSGENLGLELRCQRCHRLGVIRPGGECAICQATSLRPKCAFCRLPVARLDRVCLLCGHCMHDRCRNSVLDRLGSATSQFVCPTGCGCRCDSSGLFYAFEEDTPEGDVTLRSGSPDTDSAVVTPRGRSAVRSAMAS
ncbi:hypothetical protein CALVIDRAFT_506605 [Calocera viscosa TUFC12733]|uniref:WDR59/RTC1-like RING zinc finger domain-containing protein n=1 Tax=Calocera viscosa (strain TUFC12733) TaxID=1330018 RepID=A0A167GKA2_CALVF|nr:hypothetical protein CALVIDRAFT_506605 [Calocera viscosa TUFC12733]